MARGKPPHFFTICLPSSLDQGGRLDMALPPANAFLNNNSQLSSSFKRHSSYGGLPGSAYTATSLKRVVKIILLPFFASGNTAFRSSQASFSQISSKTMINLLSCKKFDNSSFISSICILSKSAFPSPNTFLHKSCKISHFLYSCET
ncbi:hypothetical protein CICLE_v10022726mg [Citrus x clementina]|uniref:Uncharacterized protein n=1 Tax=Citrus clementina TaxID=85681 RepID=V4VMQ2_CITCL|nr:hypothetical protein CICLE_v10022726mg [Citrus x clementina]